MLASYLQKHAFIGKHRKKSQWLPSTYFQLVRSSESPFWVNLWVNLNYKAVWGQEREDLKKNPKGQSDEVA